MVDLELIKTIKQRAEHFVTAKRGMTDTHLLTDLLSDIPSSNRELIERSISELVQENNLVRLEYRIPDTASMIHAFYLPLGSKFIS